MFGMGNLFEQCLCLEWKDEEQAEELDRCSCNFWPLRILTPGKLVQPCPEGRWRIVKVGLAHEDRFANNLGEWIGILAEVTSKLKVG